MTTLENSARAIAVVMFLASQGGHVRGYLPELKPGQQTSTEAHQGIEVEGPWTVTRVPQGDLNYVLDAIPFGVDGWTAMLGHDDTRGTGGLKVINRQDGKFVNTLEDVSIAGPLHKVNGARGVWAVNADSRLRFAKQRESGIGLDITTTYNGIYPIQTESIGGVLFTLALTNLSGQQNGPFDTAIVSAIDGSVAGNLVLPDNYIKVPRSPMGSLAITRSAPGVVSVAVGGGNTVRFFDSLGSESEFKPDGSIMFTQFVDVRSLALTPDTLAIGGLGPFTNSSRVLFYDRHQRGIDPTPTGEMRFGSSWPVNHMVIRGSTLFAAYSNTLKILDISSGGRNRDAVGTIWFPDTIESLYADENGNVMVGAFWGGAYEVTSRLLHGRAYMPHVSTGGRLR